MMPISRYLKHLRTCLFIVSILYVHISQCTEAVRLDLAGEWTLQNRNRSVVINEALVPGYVHTALLKAKVIEDPYFRNNDELYRWIDYDDWTYSRTFNVEETLMSKSTILLICEGLDTIADVYINGITVGYSTNMFQRYVWDIKEALVAGQNEIKIKFMSAVTYSLIKSKDYNHTIPPNCPPPVQHGECHVNLLRKKQCSFSWDWGPAFASAGIWKNISIQGFDSALVKDVLVNTIKANSGGISWHLDVTVIVDCGTAGRKGSVVVTLPSFEGAVGIATIHCTMFGTTQVAVSRISLLDKHGVRTWWPKGYGVQPLYDLQVAYSDSDWFEISTKIVRIGFREVELVQKQIAGGLTFYYKVNDVPIFMKGANWIPADAFEDRVSDDVIRNILQSSADANMNIVRNWGGGIYQHDSFYSIADELGLLVWQEFMFACDYYPADEKYLDSVRKEVEHQIQRLQHHPSILVWSGNNEIESSVSKNWYGVKNITFYKKSYVKLFIDTIRSTVVKLDSSRPFVSSSPSDGLQTEKEGWISSNPNSDYYGDVHYYNYTMDCLDIRGYPQPRFASEYGVQSLPQFQTLSNVTVKKDWSYFSRIMLHRQHHGSGNEQMLNQTKRHFKIPDSADPLKQFKDMLYLSQASQAICIKAESEHYRRLRSVLNEGRGHTMGAIYWQLNSIWPAPTWSSLEYGGRWKMLHYYVKDFFSPIIISPFEVNNTLYVFGVSDLLQNVSLKLTTSIWSWKMVDEPATTITMRRTIPAQSSVKLFQKDIDTLLFNSSFCKSRSQCVVTFSAVDNDGKNDIPNVPINVFYLSSLEDASLLNPDLAIINIAKMEFFNNEFLITIKSSAVAPFVWLESGNVPGRFSHNGFLITQQVTDVVFYSWQDALSLDELSAALTVSSLYDVYAGQEFLNVREAEKNVQV